MGDAESILISPETSAFRFGTASGSAPERADPVPLQQFDDPSAIADLAKVAEALVRDLDGDGVIVVWRPNLGDATFLHGAGACAHHVAGADRRLALMLTVVMQAGSSPRTYWRLADDGTAEEMLTVALPVEAGTVFLSVLFLRPDRSTRARVTEGITRLLPFVQPFIAGWVSRMAAAASIAGLTSALDGVGIGVVLVDSDGQILVANAAADRLLIIGDGLRRRGASLLGFRLADTAKLNAAIDQAIAPSKTPAANERLALSLLRANGSSLIVAVFPTLQNSVFGHAAAAVICVVDPDLDVRSLIGRVSKIYGMSRVETGLACELAMGRSLIEAATSLRVREATARTYLKQLFLKTGTHRQVELVRLLIAGAAAMPSDVRPLEA